MLREEEGVAGQQGRRGAATVGRNARRRGYLCGSLYKYLADCLLCGGRGCHCEQHARTYAFRRRAARTVLRTPLYSPLPLLSLSLQVSS